MPIINGVKYACEPCMRGHRSSKCTHDDRLLVRVRKPGRPLSSCPHLPSGATTFVDANGARLEDSTPPHEHGLGGKPCGCEVTSLAIPKVATCACSSTKTQFAHRSATPSTPNSASLELRMHPHQPFKSRVSSPPTSPISSPSIYSTSTEATGGRISKNVKKRKSISVNGEAILDLVNREAFLKLTDQQSIIGDPMATERAVETPLGLNYESDKAQINGTHLSNGQNYVSIVDGTLHSQLRGNETSTVHGPQNPIFSNVTMWGQDNWAEGFEVSLQQPAQREITLQQQPKPCCNGHGPKSTSIEPTITHDQSINQAQYQTFPPFTSLQTSSFPSMFPDSLQHMQPIATTIYTYPNGYTTINHPLTPQELRMLQATGAWSSGAAAAWSGLGLAATRNGMDAEYACSCGSACECLGCAAHPFNKSTVNFVKDMRTMMYSGRHGVPRMPKMAADPSLVAHGVARQTGGCCGGGGVTGGVQQDNMIAMVNHAHSDSNLPMSYGTPHNHQSFEHVPPHISTSNQQVQVSHPLQQNTGTSHLHNIHSSDSPHSQHSTPSVTNISPTPQHTVRPHHCRPAFPQNISSPAYTSGSSPDLAPCEDDAETEQNTVSPSAFFHIDYPLGLCSESDVGCLCGDDCACIGCMMHGNSIQRMEAGESRGTEAMEAQSVIKENGSGRTRGCCDGGRSNSRLNNPLEDISKPPTVPNGAINHKVHHLNGTSSTSNIHQKPQAHPLLGGMHDQEIADGQSMYIWT